MKIKHIFTCSVSCTRVWIFISSKMFLFCVKFTLYLKWIHVYLFIQWINVMLKGPAGQKGEPGLLGPPGPPVSQILTSNVSNIDLVPDMFVLMSWRMESV